MSVVPAAGAAGDITFATLSSPTQITAGMPVAYPVTVTNSSQRTINHITVSGAVEPGGFAFLYATPAQSCNASAVCTFAQLPAGQSLPEIVFYYTVPAPVSGPTHYVFTVTANVGEGPNDNSNAAHEDTFHATVNTVVRPPHPDFVGGHSIAGVRAFSTGLGVGGGNPHGTSVTVPTNAKVTIEDLPPGSVPACPAFAAATCFGWGSSLDVGADLTPTTGEFFPNGFNVVMRWDESQLPKGMTPKKLRVIHLLDNGTHELVEGLCTYSGGLPTNLPCFTELPFRVNGQDIEARMLWGQNGVGRGW